MSESSRGSWSMQVGVAIVVTVLVLLAMFSRASMTICGEEGRITKSIANCRQVIIALRLYAAENGGTYPDGVMTGATNSNMIFRHLIRMGYLEDEKIFGCSGGSPYQPDGHLGTPPMYPEAVKAGENHWAMTKGLTDSSAGGIPLVYENPVVATWQPQWNADAAEKNIKGRSWKGGKVIIGTNDTSIEFMKLASKTGPQVPLKPLGSEGLTLFSRYDKKEDGTPYEILDIER